MLSVIGALMLLLGTLSMGQGSAGAAPGDISNAEGEFLSGTLLDSDLALLAELETEVAASDGTSSETNTNNLDLSALGLTLLDVPGGLQIPLELTDAGVVGQYARADDDGSSFGSSGLIQSDGTIGTSDNAAEGVEPGPLSLDLSDLVSSLDLDTALLDELAQLRLSVNGVSATASQAAPDPAVGDYYIDDLKLEFESPTLAALIGELNVALEATQAGLNGLEGAVFDNLFDPGSTGLVGVGGGAYTQKVPSGLEE